VADADVRYVWRHLPLPDVHPQAELAAEAAEAAAAQDAFGRCTTCCSSGRTTCGPPTWWRMRPSWVWTARLPRRSAAALAFGPVARDVESADLERGIGTPTFFINEARTTAPMTSRPLTAAIKTARARAALDR